MGQKAVACMAFGVVFKEAGFRLQNSMYSLQQYYMQRVVGVRPEMQGATPEALREAVERALCGCEVEYKEMTYEPDSDVVLHIKSTRTETRHHKMFSALDLWQSDRDNRPTWNRALTSVARRVGYIEAAEAPDEGVTVYRPLPLISGAWLLYTAYG